MSIPRPCLHSGCTTYVYSPESRCATHKAAHERQGRQDGSRSPGTTAAWRKAREAALKRDRYHCTKCGISLAAAKRKGQTLQVHHADGRGMDAAEHPVELLVTLCTACHAPATKSQKQQRRSKTQAQWRDDIEARLRRVR